MQTNNVTQCHPVRLQSEKHSYATFAIYIPTQTPRRRYFDATPDAIVESILTRRKISTGKFLTFNVTILCELYRLSSTTANPSCFAANHFYSSRKSAPVLLSRFFFSFLLPHRYNTSRKGNGEYSRSRARVNYLLLAKPAIYRARETCTRRLLLLFSLFIRGSSPRARACVCRV